MDFLRRYDKREIILTIIGIFIVVSFLFPLYWIFINSVKPYSEIFSSPPTLFTKHLNFSTYVAAAKNGLGRCMINSFIIAIPTTLLTMILGIPTAYAIARSNLKFLNWLIIVFLLSQLMPPVLMVTPLFVFFHQLKLTNTYLSVILSVTTLTLPFFVVILRPSFLSIPTAIEESAELDGCSAIGILLRIVMPICKPAIAVASAISFLWGYANFIYPVSFLSKQEMFPTMVGLYSLVGANTTKWNVVMAYSVLVTIPAIIIFLLFHKHLVKGMTAGSIK